MTARLGGRAPALAALACVAVLAARLIAATSTESLVARAWIEAGAALAAACAVAALHARVDGEPFASALALRRPAWQHVAGAWLLGPLLATLVGTASLAAGATGALAWARVLFVGLAAELLWRGAVQTDLERRLPIGFAALATVALERASFPTSSPLWTTMAIGAALALARARSGSVVPALALRLAFALATALLEALPRVAPSITRAKWTAVSAILGAIGASCFAFPPRRAAGTQASAAG